MDAKPQRPLRTFRPFDENAIPTAPLPKTLHQRNKSSPALSTMAQAGAAKATARRTVFGDLSNTANVVRPTRDDSAIGAKAANLRSKENFPPVQEKAQGNFLKPAQRPMSVNGSRALLNDMVKPRAQKQPLAEIKPPQASSQNVGRKITAKRSTQVFRDKVPTDLPQEDNVSAEAKAVPITTNIHRELPPIPIQHATQVEEVIPKSATSTSSAITEVPEEQVVLDPQIYTDEVQVNDICEPATVLKSEYIDDQQIRHSHHEQLPSPKPTTNHYIAKVPLIDHTETIISSQYYPPMANKHTLLPVSEPEEYWEEDEPPENYEDDGYVTARSFKSRGESTTGLGTTVLFPKQTQKAKREVAIAKQLIEGSKTAEELEDEAWDTTMVAEYSEEIFEYMKELEVKMLPNAHYMDNQAEIQWSMRAVLVDWLVQVHHRFSLLPETLFLTVNYIDRFLSAKVVSMNKLQLVGATAIFIAAKYEEIDCPSVQEVQYMVDGGYTIDEILKAERFMLTMLQFELGWPGPMSFLRRISKADDYDLETRTLAKYFLEVTVMDERFIGSPPSFVAAGAHCLARMMLRKGSWSPSHVYYSGYTYSQLYSLILLMVECCEDPRRHHVAVYDKYTDKRFKRASLFAEGEMRRGFQPLPVTNSLPLGNQAILSYAQPLPPTELWCKA